MHQQNRVVDFTVHSELAVKKSMQTSSSTKQLSKPTNLFVPFRVFIIGAFVRRLGHRYDIRTIPLPKVHQRRYNEWSELQFLKSSISHWEDEKVRLCRFQYTFKRSSNEQ
ncbi:hypothetical protein EC973_006889 [Apophysomyces ossiformis]|uniref:Uncharacterized protein n=1 Tax=Apophysomyces ossiformis TaxID=679940 RepID=A0A8H7EQ51_9FUNG|nr:hypothetical protein EC973_006889 [Apophysomyces ossiformis]